MCSAGGVVNEAMTQGVKDVAGANAGVGHCGDGQVENPTASKCNQTLGTISTFVFRCIHTYVNCILRICGKAAITVPGCTFLNFCLS